MNINNRFSVTIQNFPKRTVKNMKKNSNKIFENIKSIDKKSKIIFTKGTLVNVFELLTMLNFLYIDVMYKYWNINIQASKYKK